MAESHDLAQLGNFDEAVVLNHLFRRYEANQALLQPRLLPVCSEKILHTNLSWLC